MTSIKVKLTSRPVVLTIESILDGGNCHQAKHCMANDSVEAVPLSYLGLQNFISIVTFLLKKVRWGFLVDVVLLMG